MLMLDLKSMLARGQRALSAPLLGLPPAFVYIGLSFSNTLGWPNDFLVESKETVAALPFGWQ